MVILILIINVHNVNHHVNNALIMKINVLHVYHKIII